MDCVVVNAINQFWSGRRWVSEYPDAALFTHRAAISTAAKLAEIGGEATVVSGYGSNQALHWEVIDKDGKVIEEAWSS